MKVKVAAVVLVIAAGGGLAASADGKGAAKKKTIAVKDDFFSPKSGSVKKGTTLVFQWKGKDVHNVVVTGAASGSSKVQKTGTLSVKVTKSGTVNFVCKIHSGMKGSLKVT